jgi:ubiquinone/menaquinone biosynthesis C-methylase UbiE
MSKNTARVFFEKYLKVAPLSHALWRSVEACELAKYKLTKPILDLGCGFGEFSGVFFESQIEVGVDINPQDILKAAATGKYHKTIVADARKLPFKDHSFGSVISISTLEHIPDNSQVFKEAFRVLKPQGTFFFSVPTDKLFDGLLLVKLLNALGLKVLSYLYYRALNKAFKHVFIPSEATWLKIAESAGFKIEKVQGTIPQITLIFWELGLPFASPSQLWKLFLGRRLVIAPDLKAKLYRPLARFIESDPDFKANIFVVVRKPS